MKKYLLFALIFAVTLPIFANQGKIPGAEVQEYLMKCNRLLDKHIQALSTARDAKETALVMKNYAKDMKPMVQASRAITKKFHPAANQNMQIKTEIEGMSTKIIKMNELLGEAKKKFGDNPDFKNAEKALMNAGLFGRA